jgi:hypothetical protein
MRTGGAAARDAARGASDSIHGNAIAAPTPRKNARREFVEPIALIAFLLDLAS